MLDFLLGKRSSYLWTVTALQEKIATNQGHGCIIVHAVSVAAVVSIQFYTSNIALKGKYYCTLVEVWVSVKSWSFINIRVI